MLFACLHVVVGATKVSSFYTIFKCPCNNVHVHACLHVYEIEDANKHTFPSFVLHNVSKKSERQRCKRDVFVITYEKIKLS